jgi:poly(3-hydroxybutyrate) depolymerase
MSAVVRKAINGTITRTYSVAVPDEPATERLPAIIVFQGGDAGVATGGNATDVAPFGGGSDELAGYLLAFPDPDPRLARWVYADDGNGLPTLDIEFVERLVDELTAPRSLPTTSSTFALVSADPDLLFVAGFANGAGMVWQLLHSALECRFQGFAAVGRPLERKQVEHYRAQLAPTGAAPAPAPVVYIQGTADTGRGLPPGGREAPFDGSLPAYTVREMLDRNGICSGGPAHTTLVPGSRGVAEVVLQRFDGNEAFLLGTVINGGHDWPFPVASDVARVADHFDATATILDFWRRHAGLP